MKTRTGCLIYLRSEFALMDAPLQALDGDEIRTLIKRQLGREPTAEDLAQFDDTWDQNQDGRLSLLEYITAVLGRGWKLEGFPITAPEGLDFGLLSTQYTAVDGAQNRGIKIDQLRQILRFVMHHADCQGILSWIELSRYEIATLGHRISSSKLNLYQVDLNLLLQCFFELPSQRQC